MRVIFINARKVGVVAIIIVLMLALLVLERQFDQKLKMAALIQNNINPLVEYKGVKGKFEYKIPQEWETKQKDYEGDEILYHNEFKSQDLNIWGYVQVWNKKDDLKNFLIKSKVISEKQNKILDYRIGEIKVSGYDGYLITYTMYVPKDDTKYIAYQYFIDNKDVFSNFSFFVKKENFKDNMVRIFQSIVKTLKYN